jgi:rubrerythrin
MIMIIVVVGCCVPPQLVVVRYLPSSFFRSPSRLRHPTAMEDGDAARFFAGYPPIMEEVLDQLSAECDCILDASGSGPIRSLSDEQLEQLVELANAEDREGGDMEEITVELSDLDDGNAAVAFRNAAWFVSRVEKLRYLRLGGYSFVVECNEVVDDFLDAMASDSPAQLRALTLDGFGESPETWRRFVDRFESGIEYLRFDVSFITDAMAAEVASSLRSRFRSLDEFQLKLLSGMSSGMLLLRALPDETTIKYLVVDVFDHGADDQNHAQLLVDEQNCVGDVALRCSSLLTLRFTAVSTACNGGILLERLLGSKSLEDIDLVQEDVFEDESGAETINQGLTNNQFRVINNSVKTIRFSFNRIGEETSILAYYKGLKSIKFENVRLIHEPAALTATSALESLNQLESFSFSNHREAEVRNEHVLWIASTIKAVTSLRKVKLHFKNGTHGHLSALKNVLANCSGDLSLKLRLKKKASFLVAGIQAAQSLSSFELTLEDMPSRKSSFKRILDAVQSSRGLRQFVFAVNGTDDSWPCLDPFLCGNKNLDIFRLRIKGPARSVSADSFAADQAVVTFAVRGLRHNRRLQTMSFRYQGRILRHEVKRLDPIRVTVETSQQIVAMLQQFNTTLHQIQGLEYESREHEERINYLLKLNRHGKDFAEKGDRVPIGLWSDVLSRISNAECNYFVTKKVKQAFDSCKSPTSRLHDLAMKSLRDALARTKDRLAEAEDENASLREQLESLREMSARHGRELEQALGASRGKRRG